MRKSYPSDVSRKQFEEIREELTQARKITYPRRYDLYDIFCAVLYLLKEGCARRAIPHDFPKRQNARYHYDIWTKPDENGISVLNSVLRKLAKTEREKNGREARTTTLTIDSKSVRNADTAEEKRLRRGKKVSRIKLHTGADIFGLPHAIKTTTANITDGSGAIDMITYDGAVTDRLSALQKIVADGGYTGKNFSNTIKILCGADVEVVKRNQLHTFTALPKRWIVERSFVWLGKCRRLCKNCERRLQNSAQMVSLVFIWLLLNRY